MKLIEKKIWRFKYRDIHCEIVFWHSEYMKDNTDTYKNGGVYNSYFHILKKDNPELFKEFNLRAKKWKICDSSKDRYTFDYHKLDINIHGGVTYYEKLRNETGNIYGLKIGNDYLHLGDGYETLESVERDIKETVDYLLNKQV